MQPSHTREEFAYDIPRVVITVTRLALFRNMLAVRVHDDFT